MSTFQLNLNPNKTLQCGTNKFHLTKKSQGQNPLTLTQRGLNQAHRNDSTDMWKLIHGWQGQTEADSCVQSSVRRYDFIDEDENDKSFKRSERPQISTVKNSPKESKERSQSPKQDIQEQSKTAIDKAYKSKEKQTKKPSQKRQNANKIQSKTVEPQPKDEKKYENLEKMNEQIKKYLQKQKFASRSLSNSAFAKLYNKPCVQSYGFGNTSKDSQVTKNLLKTHNITPHTNENHPQTYQSYKTALLFAKRSRIDDQDRQERLRRQFLRFFDDSVVEAAQIQLFKKNQQRKAKSQEKMRKRYEEQSRRDQEDNEQIVKQKKQRRKSLKQLLNSNQPIFVYRHTDRQGHMKVSTDRHGLTCFVDSGYHANNQALTNFQKNQRPIFPQKVPEQDMNLDQIRKQNFKKSVQECHPCHYLVPCVQTPYDKNKYQFMRKRAESTVN